MNFRMNQQGIVLLLTSDQLDDSSDEEMSKMFSESSDSSTSSEEEEEELLQLQARVRDKRPVRRRPRIEFYVDRIIPQYSAEEFKRNFRLFPDTFDFILTLIGPVISSTGRRNGAGRQCIPAKKQLLLTIWCLATPDSYRSICSRFDVGLATGVRTVRRVCKALYALARRLIKWPTGPEATEVMAQFEEVSAFPKVIGAIDGTLIKIPAPKEDAQSFVCRKGYTALHMQAVCTQKLLFTSVLAGNVGSVHDARVFRNSPVARYLNGTELYFPSDSHIIGDAAYRIHAHLLVPFKDNDHLTQLQKNYNLCLSSARMSIERTFGLWKCRWRSVSKYLYMFRIDKMPEYLVATCVLHNICLLQGDLVQLEHIDNEGIHNPPYAGAGAVAGNAKRQRIMNTLVLRIH